MPRVDQVAYIDTSVWCAYCFNETEMPGAAQWLAQASLDEAATGAWTRTEFASAAAIKRRVKGQSKAAVTLAEKAFDAAMAMTPCLNVVEDDFLYAAELCRTSETGLRAGDALHLAVALRHNCHWLASLDQAMNASARKLGLKLVKFD
mgnify:CR=1 FL=1